MALPSSTLGFYHAPNKDGSLLAVVPTGTLRQPIIRMNLRLSGGAPPVAQTAKNPPAMQETWVQFLGQENPLEKGMATHSSILA